MKPLVAVWLVALFALAADAPEDFRVVDGRLYNVQKSTNWLRLAGSPVGFTNGFVLFQNVQGYTSELPPKVIPRKDGGGNAEAGGFSDGYLDYKSRKETPIGRAQLNSSRLPPFILVRNLTSNWIGRDTNFLAMRVGNTNELQIWDVGVATNPSGTPPANREKPFP
jgi:hypothetical protein